MRVRDWVRDQVRDWGRDWVRVSHNMDSFFEFEFSFDPSIEHDEDQNEKRPSILIELDIEADNLVWFLFCPPTLQTFNNSATYIRISWNTQTYVKKH